MAGMTSPGYGVPPSKPGAAMAALRKAANPRTTRTRLPLTPYEEVTEDDGLDAMGQPRVPGSYLSRTSRIVDPSQSQMGGGGGSTPLTAIPRGGLSTLAVQQASGGSPSDQLSLLRARLLEEDASAKRRADLNPPLEDYVNHPELDSLASVMNTMFPTIAPHGGSRSRGASDMEFARAKERVGQGSRAALTNLREEMTGRGISGSGIEAKGTADLLASGGSDLSNVATTQALDALKRQYAVEDRDVNAELEQRSQRLGLFPSLMNYAQRRRKVTY